jgi:hypothetical protein
VCVLVSAFANFQFLPPLRPLHPGQATGGSPWPAGLAGRHRFPRCPPNFGIVAHTLHDSG